MNACKILNILKCHWKYDHKKIIVIPKARYNRCACGSKILNHYVREEFLYASNMLLQ